MDARRGFARALALVGTTVVVAATLTTGAASAAVTGTVSASPSRVLNTGGAQTITFTTSQAFPTATLLAPTVTVTRTGFSDQPNTLPVNAGSVTVVAATGATSSSTITATVDFSAANPGAYDVHVKSNGNDPTAKDDACTGCINVFGFTPTITSISPSTLAEGTPTTAGTTSGSYAGYQNFLIDGQNFDRGYYSQCTGTAAQCASGPNVAVRPTGSADGSDPNVQILQTASATNGTASPTTGTAHEITLRINVLPAGDAAAYDDDITVTNSDGRATTCTACLHILPQPTITSIALANTGASTIGRNATAQTLVLTGKNFRATTTSVVMTPPATTNPVSTITFNAPIVSGDGKTITLNNVSTNGVQPGALGAWSVTVGDATTKSRSNAVTLTVDDIPTPGTAVVHNDSTRTDGTTAPAQNQFFYGQGAQTVHFTVPVTGGTFTPGTGLAGLHTHIAFTNLPSGVHVTAEAATSSPNVVTDTLSVDAGTQVGAYTFNLINPDGGTSAVCTNGVTGSPPLSSSKENSCALGIDAAPVVGSLSTSTFVAGTVGGSLTIIGSNFHGGPSGDPNSTSSNLVHVVIARPGGSTYVSGDFTPSFDSVSGIHSLTISPIGVPLNETAGDANITITNADDHGVTVCTACIHVAGFTVDGVVDTVSNTSADTNDQPASLAITGKNLETGVTFALEQIGVASIPLTNVHVTNPGTNSSGATGTADLTGVAPGFYSLVAVNPDNSAHPGTASLDHAFQVLASPPTSTNVSPNKAGGGATNLAVTITGTNIYPGAQMSFTSASVTLIGNPTIASDHKSLTQHISVAPNAASEIGSVTVYNSDGQHPASPLTFTIDPAPVVNTLNPASHAAGTSFTLTIGGSGFSTSPLPQVDFSDAGVTGSVTGVSNAGDSITVSMSVATGVATTSPVSVQVSVTNPDHGTAASASPLTINPQPTVSSVSPGSVAAGSTVPQLQILGSGFQTGATVAPHAANSGLTFGTPTVVSPSEIDVPVTVDPAAAKGVRVIDVANPDAGATTANLSIFTVPSVPQSVVAASGAARSVTVSWAAPADNGGSSLTSYTVTLAKQGSPTTAASFTTTDASTLQHTFTATDSPAASLENGTTYVAQVVATNAAGNSTAAPASGATATTYALPKAPSSLTATGGVRTVDLSWPAVTDAGNDPAGIASYTVTLVKRGADPNTTQTFVTPDGSTLSHQFTGLANGSTYDATVRATNTAGDSPTTGASATTFDVPSAPSNANAVPADGTLAVTWNAPSSDGGTPVTGYTVTLTPSGGDSPATTTSTQHTFTGLTNGQDYTISIVATNAAGDSQAATTDATPVPAPPAPAPAAATPGNGTLDVTWTAPSSPSGHAVSSYTATVVRHDGVGNPVTFTSNASDSGGLVTEHVFTGLVNGQLYDVSVTATNDIGTGPAATTSGTPRTTAQAPTGVTAAAGDAKVTVSWTAPADSGGAAITHYVVTANPGNHQVTTADGTTTHAVVTGLANGTAYSVTVLAQNAAGDGASSTPVSATPKFVTTVTIATSKPSVSYGTKITLSGKLLRSNSAPISGASVLVFRVPDVGGTAHIATAKTDSFGRWSYTFAPGVNAYYYARYLGDGADVSSGSTKVRTLVAVVIRFTSPLNNSKSSVSSPLVVKGSVTPNKYGARVTLYYVTSTGRLVALGSTTVSKTSTYAFSVKLGKGTWHLRATIGSTTNNIGARTSVLTVSRV